MATLKLIIYNIYNITFTNKLWATRDFMTVNKADIKHTRQEQTKNIIEPNIKKPNLTEWSK